jgi:glycosyltransferase involved in cell wall biosynthesis
MTIAITIPTYQREDGGTPKLLSRTLESVKNQSYQDYKVFLIGDAYENDEEFKEIATSIIDSSKIYFENLSVPVERSKYQIGSKELWCSAGINARNYAINIVISEGLNYVCPLDHDDYWSPDHLESIVNILKLKPDSSFVYTCGSYFDFYLPHVPLTNEIIPFLPVNSGTIHSSTCINYDLIPLRYRDVFEETGKSEPSDADLWLRIGEYIQNNNLESYLFTSLTCFHPTENS